MSGEIEVGGASGSVSSTPKEKPTKRSSGWRPAIVTGGIGILAAVGVYFLNSNENKALKKELTDTKTAYSDSISEARDEYTGLRSELDSLKNVVSGEDTLATIRWANIGDVEEILGQVKRNSGRIDGLTKTVEENYHEFEIVKAVASVAYSDLEKGVNRNTQDIDSLEARFARLENTVDSLKWDFYLSSGQVDSVRSLANEIICSTFNYDVYTHNNTTVKARSNQGGFYPLLGDNGWALPEIGIEKIDSILAEYPDVAEKNEDLVRYCLMSGVDISSPDNVERLTRDLRFPVMDKRLRVDKRFKGEEMTHYDYADKKWLAGLRVRQ